MDLLLEVVGGLGLELDVPERGPIHSVPTPVEPRSHYQNALVVRIALLDLVVDGHGTVEILGIEPAAHVQDRMMYIVQVRQNDLVLPIGVVGPVVHELVPSRNRVAEVPLVDVRDGTEVEKEAIAVGSAVVEGSFPFGRDAPS